MSLYLPLCLVALACFQFADGYSGGAPPAYCGATGTMVPGHGMQPQTSVIPYTLTANSGQLTYSPGETISLTLAGGTFTGFLIQALSASTNTILGTMSAPAGSKVLSCGGSGNNGLTHSNKDPKSSFSFQWEGPDTTTSGAVTFLVTVVQDYSTYWVRQQLLTLTPAATVTTPSAITSETSQTTASQITVTPLPQTTVVSSSASTPLTTKPSSQVTSNNPLDFANAPVTRTDIYTPQYSGYNALTTDSYHDSPHNTDHFRNYSPPNTRKDSHSSFYHTTAVGHLKENNNVATTTDSYSFHNTASIAAYFNSNAYEENNFTNSEIYHKITTTSERIYETTPPSVRRSNQTPTYFNTVDYQKVAYSTGRFENVNHRAKVKNSDILSTHIGKLPRNDSSRTVNNVFTIKVNETLVVPEATTFSFQTFNVFNDTENIQGEELDNWIDNNEHVNFTNGALDKNKNYTLFEILREPQRNETTGILNKLKENQTDTLRITELPLSDPDRIFDVAKQILQKDNTGNLQFKQVIEVLRNVNNESDTLISNYRTSTVPTEHINILIDNVTKSQEASTVSKEYASETTPALLTNTHLSNRNTGKHDNNKNVITYNNSDSITETTLSQWDISTTQPTVTIQGGSRSTTLKEIVSKWMREHVHDIPDLVSTPTSNNRDVSKGKDGGDSKVNETNNVRNLDFHFPELEVINVDCQRRTA